MDEYLLVFLHTVFCLKEIACDQSTIATTIPPGRNDNSEAT